MSLCSACPKQSAEFPPNFPQEFPATKTCKSHDELLQACSKNKCRLSKCPFSARLTMEKYSRWGAASKNISKQPWACAFTLLPCGSRCRCNESAIHFLAGEPTIEILILQKENNTLWSGCIQLAGYFWYEIPFFQFSLLVCVCVYLPLFSKDFSVSTKRKQQFFWGGVPTSFPKSRVGGSGERTQKSLAGSISKVTVRTAKSTNRT